MRLKRNQDVEWSELNKVESPNYAKAMVEANVNCFLHDSYSSQGVNNVIWDDLQPNHHTWDEGAIKRLLERLERGEVFLIHGHGSEPVCNAVRRVEAGQGVDWKIDSSLSLDTQYNVQRMLSYAVQTRGIHGGAIHVKKEATRPKVEKKESKSKAVSNPRWEHADAQRAQSRPGNIEAGDEVLLKVDVNGLPDGSKVTFNIFDTSVSPPGKVGSARGIVEGGVGTARWKARKLRPDAKLGFDGKVRGVSSGNVEIPTSPVNGPTFRGNYKAGKKGQWSSELNKPKPNSVYVVDGITYKIDSLGRVASVEAPKLKLNKSARNGYQQRVSGRKDRKNTDVGGHLIGSRFGGAGEGINIVAMDNELNSNDKVTGQFGQLEERWAKAVEEGKEVSVTIKPRYAGDSTRPDGFTIEETIDGKLSKIRLLNKPGG